MCSRSKTTVALRVYPLVEDPLLSIDKGNLQREDEGGAEQRGGDSGGGGGTSPSADSAGGGSGASRGSSSPRGVSGASGGSSLLRETRALREAALIEACEMRCGVEPHANILQMYGAFKVSCRCWRYVAVTPARPCQGSDV